MRTLNGMRTGILRLLRLRPLRPLRLRSLHARGAGGRGHARGAGGRGHARGAGGRGHVRGAGGRGHVRRPWRRPGRRAAGVGIAVIAAVATAAVIATAAAAAAVLMPAASGWSVAAGAAHLRTRAVERLEQTLLAAGFGIDEITVQGRRRVSSAALLDALGVEAAPSPTQSILLLDIHEARRRVERLGWVETASVTRMLPARLHVEIREREPFVIWQHKGRLFLADRHAEVILEGRVGPFRDLPLVVGEGAAREAAALLAALEPHPGVGSRMQAAVRVGGRRWNLRLKNGMDVRLPEAALEPALDRLARLEAAHGLFARAIEIIDLRLPDRIAVRLHGAPQAAASPASPPPEPVLPPARGEDA